MMSDIELDSWLFSLGEEGFSQMMTNAFANSVDEADGNFDKRAAEAYEAVAAIAQKHAAMEAAEEEARQRVVAAGLFGNGGRLFADGGRGKPSSI